jgi:hypothetical protein
MSIRRAAFGVAFFTLGLLPVLLAADPPSPVGFPKKGDGGGDGVFRVWLADGSWHLRTSTENTAGKKGKLLVFTGSVRCDGKVTAAGKKLEKGKGKTSDFFTPHADGKGFDFQFKTYGATDQVDFTVAEKAKSLRFKLFLNGEKAATHRIVIGAKSEHPEKSEFTLPARPK